MSAINSQTPDDALVHAAPSLVDIAIPVHIEHVQLHKNYSTHCQYTRGCSHGGPLIVILCCMTAIATTATHVELLTITCQPHLPTTKSLQRLKQQ